jgi:hypothetical protein
VNVPSPADVAANLGRLAPLLFSAGSGQHPGPPPEPGKALEDLPEGGMERALYEGQVAKDAAQARGEAE